MTVTLKDIARKTGVSISTVSRVINGDNDCNVNPVIEKDIWDWVEKLGYIRNKSGQSKRKKIGYILSEITRLFDHPYFSVIVQEIEIEATKQGYDIAFAELEENLKEPSKLYNLIQKEADGIIIISDYIEYDMFKKLEERFNNIVFIGNRTKDIHVDTVCVDRKQAAYRAVNNLIRLGHREIGFIGGHIAEIMMEDEKRYNGYKEALESDSIKINPDIVKVGTWELESGYECMKEILSLNKLPTAMFVASDLMAIGAMRAIHENNLQIPENISIVSYDNIKMAKFTNPPLTTIDVPKKELARVAVQTLIHRINKESDLPRKVILPTKFINGKTIKGVANKNTKINS